MLLSNAKIIYINLFTIRFSNRFPFDYRSPLGYLVTGPIEYGIEWCIAGCSNCASIMVIGSGFMLISLTKDLSTELRNCNEISENPTKQFELYKKLSEFVELHSDAKQLSD